MGPNQTVPDGAADLLSDLRTAANQLTKGFEAKVATTVVTNIVPTATSNYWQGAPEGLDAVLNSWNLPADVLALMQQAAFADTVEFTTFAFTIKHSDVSFESYMGAGHYVNNVVNVVWVRVASVGKQVQQTTTVHTRNCHSCWVFFTCCSDATQIVPRGVSQDELMTIWYLMRAATHDAMIAAINAIPATTIAKLQATIAH